MTHSATRPTRPPAGDTVHAKIGTHGPHVDLRRVGPAAPKGQRNTRRTLCGRSLDAIEVEGGTSERGCVRCRLGLTRLLSHMMNMHGPTLPVEVNGQPWPARVVRALGPPLLDRAIRADAPPPNEPTGHRWRLMRVAGSSTTHVALESAVVHDGTWDAWWIASDDQPTMTACLRTGEAAPDADPHPSKMCPACAAGRDRVASTLRVKPDPAAATPDDPSTAVTPAPGATIGSTATDAERLLVVASLTSTAGGHARLDQLLRADASMATLHPVERVAAMRPGRPTLCGDEPDTPTHLVTPLGGCRRCAGAVSRVAAAVQRQWPLARPAMAVDGQPVPASVLGGARIRLGDPALLPHITFAGPAAERPDDLIDRCRADDGLVHLGWAGRVEGTAGTGWWAARRPSPAVTLCEKPAGADPTADQPCRACADKALSRVTRFGRHGPAPAGTIRIAGATYDPALSALMGPAFVVEMLMADLQEQ